MKQRLLFLVAFWLCVASAPAAETPAFVVTLDAKVETEPVSGRVYVFLSRQPAAAPIRGPNWFHPEPFFGVDVQQFKPGDQVTLADNADGFPQQLSKLPGGRYRVQAVLDHSFDAQHHAAGAGNFHSRVVTWNHDPQKPAKLELLLDQVIQPRPFRETELVKEVVLESKLLSQFHQRKVVMRCAVKLPPSYHKQPNQRYPVLLVIPGFSGSHRRTAPVDAPSEVEIIQVLLNGQCKWGHHVFADSATNGPRGTALVRELIPHLDQKFRTVAAPTARFLTGISSGGWSSLWLQVAYPDDFGGVWSVAPDPVDFRDFQRVNLYADPPLSLYFDEQGKKRPLARRGDEPILWYADFAKMDDVLKRGGQLRSFEAVFSPLNEQGLPQKLWDRETGRIDPKVAQAWRKYDIRLKLENNWEALQPKLAGKISVHMGDKDTFYLEGATRLLRESLSRLGSDARITIVPGANHFSIWSGELKRQIRKELANKFLRHHPPQ